jgi:hypothetical protein
MNLKEQIIKEAKEQFKDIYPVCNKANFMDCFTEEDNKIHFWFNTAVDDSTRVITRELN